MYIENLIEIIRNESNKVSKKALDGITYQDCFANFKYKWGKEIVEVKLNTYTLDINNRERLPSKLSSGLFKKLRDSKILKNKFRKERRAFLKFLKLYFPNTIKHLEFIDRESPDFLVKDRVNKYYEIVEASNQYAYNNLIYHNAGMGFNEQDYRDKINESFYSIKENVYIQEFNNQVVLSPSRGSVDTQVIRDKVVKMAEKKVLKYRKYKGILGDENILVFHNTLGISNKSDFNDISKKIKNSDIINSSDVNYIYILDCSDGLLLEYSKGGFYKMYK